MTGSPDLSADVNPMTVGDICAKVLTELEVTEAFGVTSVHNLLLLDAIACRGSTRFVMARGEMGAAHMADGYARATGRLGVVISSTGPAAANAVPGLLEATLAGSPVLHITGQVQHSVIGRGTGAVHDVPNQSAMLASVCKASLVVASPTDVGPCLRKAARLAMLPPFGAVSVEIPIDVQQGAATFAAASPPPVHADLAIADVTLAAEKLLGARRVILWLGGGAKEAARAAQRLLNLGFVGASSWNGRGIVSEDDPRNLGAMNGIVSKEIDAFYATADAIVVVGSRLRHQQTRDRRLRLPRPMIQIDIDPAARDRTYRADVFVEGDAGRTLEALAGLLEGHFYPDPRFVQEAERATRAARTAMTDALGPYARFPERLRAAMPTDACWVRDMTMSNNTWGHHAFPVRSAHDNLFPVGGGIGVGLPLALGAAASGRTTVLMTGDGGFALNSGEFLTAVQENLPLTVIVMNDRGYGVIRHLQNLQCNGRHHFTNLLGHDLRGFAALSGAVYHRVIDPDALFAAVRETTATRRPAIVEVDMTAIGPLPYRPLSAPQRND